MEGSAWFPTFTSLSRRVGAAHLVGAGIVHVVIGLWLFASASSDRLVALAITEGSTVVEDVTLLQSAHLIERLPVAGVLVGIGLLAVAAVEIASGWRAYGARGWRTALVTAVCGSVTLVTLPLGLIAAVLLTVTRQQFGEEPSA